MTIICSACHGGGCDCDRWKQTGKLFLCVYCYGTGYIQISRSQNR